MTLRLPEAAPGRRPGLTLLEVILAMTIFLFSLAAITTLLSSSSRRALEASLRSEAALRCQSKMAEVMAGVQPLSSSGSAPFSDDPNWSWQLECSETDVTNLWNVQVTVQIKRGSGMLELSVAQKLFAPANRGSTLVSAVSPNSTILPPSTSSSSSTGSSSSSGSSSGSTGGTSP